MFFKYDIMRAPHWKKENPKKSPNDPPTAETMALKSKIKYSSRTSIMLSSYFMTMTV